MFQCCICKASFADKLFLKEHLKVSGHRVAPKKLVNLSPARKTHLTKGQCKSADPLQLVLSNKPKPAAADLTTQMGALQLKGMPVSVDLKFKQEIGETQKRISIVVHAFIDVSASMCGSRVTETKKSLHALLEELGPNNALTLHTFANQVKPLTGLVKPGQPLAGKKVNLERLGVAQAIEAIQPSGGTALYQAMIEGALCVQRSRQENVEKRLSYAREGAAATAADLKQAHQDSRHEKLVIVTDSDDTVGGFSLEEAVEALAAPLAMGQNYEVYVLAVGDAAAPGSCVSKIAAKLHDKVEVVKAQDSESIATGFATICKKLFRHVKLSIQARSDEPGGLEPHRKSGFSGCSTASKPLHAAASVVRSAAAVAPAFPSPNTWSWIDPRASPVHLLTTQLKASEATRHQRTRQQD